MNYTVSDMFAASVRGEYYADPQGYTTNFYVPRAADTNLNFKSFTLTLAGTPTPNLVIKLDNRIDMANDDVFQKKLRDTSKTQFTTTLGLVATTW